MELVKRLPVHQYSVDIFSHSGLSGTLGSHGKQKTTETVLGGLSEPGQPPLESPNDVRSVA